MHIAVTAVGTEGDLRPFIALTRRLREAGHDAFLVASGLAEERAAEAGIPHRRVGEPLPSDKSLIDAQLRASFEAVMRDKNPRSQATRIFDHMAGRLVAALPDM